MSLPQVPAPPPFPETVIIGGGPPEWLAPVIVIMLISIIAGVLLYPMAKAWARRTEAGLPDEALQEEVAHLRDRVAELEHNVMAMRELEERLDFAERMLTQRAEPVRLPREGGV